MYFILAEPTNTCPIVLKVGPFLISSSFNTKSCDFAVVCLFVLYLAHPLATLYLIFDLDEGVLFARLGLGLRLRVCEFEHLNPIYTTVHLNFNVVQI